MFVSIPRWPEGAAEVDRDPSSVAQMSRSVTVLATLYQSARTWSQTGSRLVADLPAGASLLLAS